MALWQAWTDPLHWMMSILFGIVQTPALRRVLTARAGGSLA
jgi:hypothetical protein